MAAVAGKEMRWPRVRREERGRASLQIRHWNLMVNLCNLSVGGVFVESFPAGQIMSKRSLR